MGVPFKPHVAPNTSFSSSPFAMELRPIDVAVLIVYLVGMIVVGFVAERRARRGMNQYFLGANELPWWVLSLSNAASMFDISGTMWLVSLLFVYGLKSIFIPWLWPVFNQVFLMVYLSAWLRRSGAMTGAEWITLRFGRDRGAEASRISVVIYALVGVIGFTGYAFVGIAKFADVFLPDLLSPNVYALIIVGVTTLYTVVGGFYSVVLTDLIQFCLMVVCSLTLGFVAVQQASPEVLAAAVPAGWEEISFGWTLDLDWSQLLPAAEQRIHEDGYTMFGAFFMMMLFKGVLVSMAGPAPNYDMQRILAAKNAREACLMSSLVTVVLFTPRFLMVAGITVLALILYSHDGGLTGPIDLEQVLPIVIRESVPTGLRGLLIAGLLAAFMSTFAGTINAAAAYLVNDVYKRYLRPAAGQQEYVQASYGSSIILVAAGCAAGYSISSVDNATQWIVSALWGGYAAANVLKWHWWRLNGFGYFAGMIGGVVGALILLAFPHIKLLTAFPLLLLVSATGAVAGSLLTKPEDEDVLVEFYTRTRPWGWWGPIHRAAMQRDPDFKGNRDFGWDALNVVVGIVWQTAFVVLPIYAVIHHWSAMTASLATIIVTSAILKRTWYDRLPID
jgi:Na+/proline symporter